MERGNLTVKYKSIIEDVLIGCGITVSLMDIQQVLSIILLVFNVLWILWKFGYKIYQSVKNKQPEEIGNAIEDAKDELEQLTGKDSKDKE